MKTTFKTLKIQAASFLPPITLEHEQDLHWDETSFS
jgi:hypothetical protein